MAVKIILQTNSDSVIQSASWRGKPVCSHGALDSWPEENCLFRLLSLAYLSHILSGKQGNRDATLVEDLIVAPPYLLQPVIELPWRSSDSDPLLPDSSIESEPPIVFGCQIKLVSASNQRDLSNLNLGGALDLILECSHGGYNIEVTEKGNRSGNKTMMRILGANKVVQCNSISIAAWLGNWYMTL
ncbi:hypothetical protein Leryth_007378 [Lithospermum erythrorhizon]|nr:hypothetical protein Leryth_007378 [Lithospermum erythrorhizon]